MSVDDRAGGTRERGRNLWGADYVRRNAEAENIFLHTGQMWLGEEGAVGSPRYDQSTSI